MRPNDFGMETAEPMVGEVTALRSFRITDDGYFLPLTDAGGHESWPTETSAAKCNRGKSHLAPDPECSCGFYAYGNSAWVERDGLYSWSRLVLAAVHCSGRLVAGEKGLRAQKMRLVACYVSRATPKAVLERLRENYPEVEFLPSRRALLKSHPETHLSTYIPAPKIRFRITTAGLQALLLTLAVPFILWSLFGPLTAPLSEITAARLASLLFAFLVWVPIFIEGFVSIRVGASIDSIEGMRRAIARPWSEPGPGRVMREAMFRFGLLGFGIALVFSSDDDPLLPLGWSALPVLGLAVGAGTSIWLYWRRAFPFKKTFPLVPRTLAVQALRDSLPPDATPSRVPVRRQERAIGGHVIEVLDMGGYGVGMVHYSIYSDPEDHPPAMGSAPALTLAIQTLMKEFEVPQGRWVTYIASNDANLRILTSHGAVSPPVALTEIDAILPIPSLTWCAPGVRSAYVSGLADGSLNPEDAPFALLAGYRDGRSDSEAFSDASIGNALNIARRMSEQSGYRAFKRIEADLPEGLKPVAVPLLPSEPGGDPSDDQKSEMRRALVTLMDSPTDISSSKDLLFSMGELIDSLSIVMSDLNDAMSIDVDADPESMPQDRDESMRGGHLLLLGSVGPALTASEVVTAYTFDGPEGRTYAVFVEMKKKSGIKATLTIRDAQSEGGGDDDVDALEDADQ